MNTHFGLSVVYAVLEVIKHRKNFRGGSVIEYNIYINLKMRNYAYLWTLHHDVGFRCVKE